MQSTTDQFRSAASDLESYATEIEGVRTRLRASVSASSGVGARLRRLNEELRRTKNDTVQMGALAGNVCELYRSTESVLSGQSEAQETSDDGSAADPVAAKDSWFLRLLKNDFDSDGAVISRDVATNGAILGLIPYSGEAGYKFLSYEFKTTGGAEWNLDKNEAEIKKEVKLSGSVLSGEASGDLGLLHGKAEGAFLTGCASGAIGATLYQDGKLNPTLYAKASVEGEVLKGKAEAHFGSDDYNEHVSAEGKVLEAKAGAEGGIGAVSFTDNAGNTQSGYGAYGKVGAEAYVAKGEIKGGYTIAGIKIDVSIGGGIGGASATVGGAVTTTGASGKIGLGVVAGLELGIDIDWSKCTLW